MPVSANERNNSLAHKSLKVVKNLGKFSFLQFFHKTQIYLWLYNAFELSLSYLKQSVVVGTRNVLYIVISAGDCHELIESSSCRSYSRSLYRCDNCIIINSSQVFTIRELFCLFQWLIIHFLAGLPCRRRSRQGNLFNYSSLAWSLHYPGSRIPSYYME